MHLKLSTRLIAHSVLMSIVPIIIISAYVIYVISVNLEASANNRLSLEREAKLEELTSFFDLQRKQIITWSKNAAIISAMKDFRAAIDDVEDSLGKRYDGELAANEDLLKSRYAYQQSHTPDAPPNAVSKWWPKDRISRILQHYYISANPYPIGEKDKLDFSADGSRYSQAHRQIHPFLRDLLEQFQYGDIYLVDPKDGRIVYSVKKSVDFGTSLITGPYNDSNLAKVFKTVLKADGADAFSFVDMEPYAPSFNEPEAFIASPIFDGDTKIGIMIFDSNVGRLDEITTSNHRWEDIGLGKTGEVIIVGNDHTLRSESRFMLEDSTTFLRDIKKIGISDEIAKAMELKKTAVGILPFQSPIVESALNGKSGVTHAPDYTNDQAVIAYAPFNFGGVTWALAVTLEESEAFATLYSLRAVIIGVATLVAILVAFIGWLFARGISRPITQTINTLSTSSNQMAATTAEHERIANQQAASINETNTTMEELGISSKQSALQAQTASEAAHTVLILAEEGAHQVQEMLNGMEGLRGKVDAIAQQILKLSEQTGQISTITGMMTDFANETKMLAMNAAVEAVRAGEHGKGFSVLSVEIRKLAEESRRSAERINALVVDVQKATNATVIATEEGTKNVEKTIDLAHTTASSFNSVSESMHTASESAQQISLNIKQQAEAIRQVVEAMNELKIGAREGATGISQTKIGIQTLNEAAQKLKAMT